MNTRATKHGNKARIQSIYVNNCQILSIFTHDVVSIKRVNFALSFEATCSMTQLVAPGTLEHFCHLNLNLSDLHIDQIDHIDHIDFM